MKSDQEKLANFEKIVLNDAYKERELVIARLEEQKKETLLKSEEKFKEQHEKRYNNEVEKIKRKYNEETIKNSVSYKVVLLKKREELIDKLFQSVITRVKEFTKTKDYEMYMQDTILKASKLIPMKNTILKISENDKGLNLKSSSFNIEYIKEDIIGGFYMEDTDSGIIIDETFVSKINKQKDEFLEYSHIQLA